MADINNIDEYRASVLSALGIEDDVNIRYFADYRKALLMGLSMPASNEDLRNEEKFRLKILEAVSNTNELISDLLNGTEYTEKTASGNPAFFDDGACGLPLKSLLVNISPKQSGSGDPSSTNIRTIEPLTEVKIFQSGEDTNNYITKRIPLNREVYGGTLDVVSGELVINRKLITLLSIADWNESTLSTGVFRGYISDIVAPVASATTEAIMDRRKPSAWSPIGASDTEKFAISPTKYIVIPMGRAFNSIDEFLNETGDAQLCYPLATPVTIQLTSPQVKTLLGANNIWASTGAVVAKYLAKVEGE